MVQTIYDIKKTHGGTISVETLSTGEAGTENKGLSVATAGTEFIITLPI